MEKNYFEFTSFSYTGKTASARFDYTVYLENRDPILFTEKIQFPVDVPMLPKVDSELLENLLFNLHLILGISYWKMHCLKSVVVKSGALTQKQAQFWNTIYKKGLGEFFYRNSIDQRDIEIFKQTGTPTYTAVKTEVKPRSLVGIGGGKDSALAIEKLLEKKIDTVGFYVETDGRHGAEDRISQTAGIPYLRISRTLDPQIRSMAKTGEVPSGHVPVSAMFAWIGIAVSVLYGFSEIVTGNERSADFGNVVYQNETINHQWSKSSEFESMFSSYLTSYITDSIRYYSILRPYSELAIVSEFIKYPKYFPVFSSCNRVSVKFDKAEKRWCGACAKCAFVYATMSAYLPKRELIPIFGSDLFQNSNLVPLYRQLMGIAGIKPFDCVGTPEEVKLALYMAYKTGSYAGEPVMELFEREILPKKPNWGAIETSVLAK